MTTEQLYGTDRRTLLSETLRMLRFPMIFGIIVIHCYLPIEVDTAEIPFAALEVMYAGSEILARICVPLFFAISGFLFFYRKEHIGWPFFLMQWRKRVKTLMVPYLLWNIIAFLFLKIKAIPALSSRFFPGMAGVNLSFRSFVRSFWEFSFPGVVNEPSFFDPMHGPVDFPLWFIRDLILLVILTPLIYKVLKMLGWLVPGTLAVCFVGGWWFGYCPGFSITGVLFFTLGCQLAIARVNPLDALWGKFSPARVTLALSVVYAVVAVADLLTRDQGINLHFHAVGILVGIAWLFSLFGVISAKQFRMSHVLTASSFFVYAFHGLISSLVSKVAILIVKPGGNLAWISSYLLAILLLAGVSVAVYIVCSKLAPRVVAFITGGRSSL